MAAQPPAARRQLRRIRQLVRAALPKAVDGFSYGIPALPMGVAPLDVRRFPGGIAKAGVA